LKKILKILILICLMNIGMEARALQKVITVPSSDVLKKDAILLKQVSRVFPYKGGNVLVIPSATVGLGWGTEASVSVPVNIMFNDGAASEKINIEAKKVFYLGSDNNRLTVGGLVGPSLNMPVCPDMFLYAHATRYIPKTRTTFTAGGYLTGENHFTNKGGMILTLDQGLIGNKLRVVTELLTGENNRSLFGAGLKYKLMDDFSISGAFIVPIQGADNVGFQLVFSKFIFPEKQRENL